MSFKTLGQTLFFLCCIAVIYFVDVSAFLPVVLWASAIVVVLTLLYALYLTKHWGKPLFVLLTGLFLFAMPVNAQLTQEKLAQINSGRSLCDADKSADTYDSALKNKAFEILSIAETMEKKDLNSRAKDIITCAKQYLYFVDGIESKKTKVCPSMAAYLNRTASDCWICGVGFLLIESAQKLVSYTEVPMRVLALQIVAVMMLFWIAIKVLMLFGTWGFASVGEFFATFLQRFLIVLIVVAFLYVPLKQVFSLTISPLINMGAGLGIYTSDLAMVSADGQSFAEMTEKKFGIDSDIICPYCERMKDKNYTFMRSDASYTSVFEDSAINAMLCLTCRIYRQVAPFLAMGQSFVCTAIYVEYERYWWQLWMYKIPDIFMLMVGLILIVVFGILLFMASFYMIDAFFRLGLVALFMPLFVATYAFPISRQYTVKGFSIIVYSILELVGLSIALGLATGLFVGFVPNADSLIEVMHENDVKEMLKTLTDDGSYFIFLVLIGTVVIGYKMIIATGTLVTSLSGISSPTGGNIGTGVGTGMAQSAWNTAKLAAGMGMASYKSFKDAKAPSKPDMSSKEKPGEAFGASSQPAQTPKKLEISDEGTAGAGTSSKSDSRFKENPNTMAQKEKEAKEQANKKEYTGDRKKDRGAKRHQRNEERNQAKMAGAADKTAGSAATGAAGAAAGQFSQGSGGNKNSFDWAQNEKNAYAQGDNPISSGDLTKQDGLLGGAKGDAADLTKPK